MLVRVLDQHLYAILNFDCRCKFVEAILNKRALRNVLSDSSLSNYLTNVGKMTAGVEVQAIVKCCVLFQYFIIKLDGPK